MVRGGGFIPLAQPSGDPAQAQGAFLEKLLLGGGRAPQNIGEGIYSAANSVAGGLLLREMMSQQETKKAETEQALLDLLAGKPGTPGSPGTPATLGSLGAGTGFAGSPELGGQTNLGTPGTPGTPGDPGTAGLLNELSRDQIQAAIKAGAGQQLVTSAFERALPDPMAQAQIDIQREGLGLQREGMELKRDQFASDQEFNRAKLALEERKIASDQAGAGAAKLSDVSSFRGQYTGLSENFLATRDAYGKLRSAAVAEPSAASDIALISGYMKILDPTSIVREGEYATAANAGGIPDRIRNAWNSLIDGTRLTPEQRAEFVNQGHGLFQSALQQQEELQTNYRGIASRMAPNVLPDDAVPDFVGTSREWKAVPKPPPLPEQGLVDKAVGAVEGAAQSALGAVQGAVGGGAPVSPQPAEIGLARYGVPPLAERVAGQRYKIGTRELTWDGSRWQE